jgi:hypothetical protein
MDGGVCAGIVRPVILYFFVLGVHAKLHVGSSLSAGGV